jgi:biotin carboxyl carrier protein
MSVHRLRAITDDGTFAVEVEGDRARLHAETEPLPRNTDAQRAADAGGAAGAGAVETTFQIAPIDAGIVSISSGVTVGVSNGDRVGVRGGASGTLEEAATPLRAYVVADGDTTWVFIDGETFTIEVEPAERARPRRGAAGNEGLAAPMPATVIKVLVEPGAEVHRGDVLLLLEAMKMELPVRAPRDGRVKALHCRPGELVQPGTALVDLE